MSSYYSDDEVDVQVRHVRAPSPRRPPPPPHYIQTIPRERPISAYRAGNVMLQPERTVVTTRSRSRERRSSPPQQQMAPVVIRNEIYNDRSDSDDWSSDEYHHHHHRRRKGHSHSHGHSHSRASSSGHSDLDGARDKWELEKARQELTRLQLSNQANRVDREREEKLKEREKRYREEYELEQARKQLKEEKQKQEFADREKIIRKEIELKKLEEEKKAHDEAEARKKMKEDAVKEWKAKEAERIEKERLEKEKRDKEYQDRLRNDLLASGLSDKDIEAIMKKERIKKAAEEKNHPGTIARPTYTRMALRHLEIETLIYYKIEFEYDQEPGFVLIKRWVPEWEQDMLWEHTRKIRIVEKKRDDRVVLEIDGHKKHKHHKDDDFEWVRKKDSRRRSKSPGLLMYLAGGRPA